MRIFQPLTSLETIDMRGNKLLFGHAHEFVERSGLNSTNLSGVLTEQVIERMNLSINLKEANCLNRTLMCLSSLKTLNLSETNITEETVVDLMLKIKYLQSLHELDLYGNQLGSNGTILICHSLGYLSSLQCLNLGGNKIESKGVKYLSNSIYDSYQNQYSCAIFEKVRETSNAWMQSQMRAVLPNIEEFFYDTVKKGFKLITLNVSYNNISSSLLDENTLASDDFTTLLGKVQTLRDLDLSGNEIELIDRDIILQLHSLHLNQCKTLRWPPKHIQNQPISILKCYVRSERATCK
jgi:Ran GTPase-activating protein (RanGAP) involved in mRNA processing and transport